MKKKQFKPIRRGAPSLPFDFTEALKEMEVEKEEIKNKNLGYKTKLICDHKELIITE